MINLHGHPLKTTPAAQKIDQSKPNTDNQILQAIGDLRSSVEGKIDELKVDLSLIRQDLRQTVERVTEAESCISDLEDTQKTHRTDIARLLRTDKQLELGAEDAEGHSR